MAEAVGQATPHAYLVAGGGGGMRSTIVLRLLAQELTDRNLPYTVIEGVSGQGDEQAVRYPTLQVHDMEAHIADLPEGKPLLFVAHCIGTIAALRTVERVANTRPAALVSIASPLPSPRETIRAPQSQKKRSQDNTLMRVVDLPAGALDYSDMSESRAHIDPQYFVDIDAAGDLEVRLRARVELGSAALLAPEHDWNVGSPQCVRAWHDDWRATLPPELSEAMLSRAAIVADAAHGLYVSPRSGRHVTPEEDIAFQLANVGVVIDTGLGLLTSAEHLVSYDLA